MLRINKKCLFCIYSISICYLWSGILSNDTYDLSTDVCNDIANDFNTRVNEISPNLTLSSKILPILNQTSSLIWWQSASNAITVNDIGQAITGNSNDQYGLMVISIGDSSIVTWQYKTNSLLATTNKMDPLPEPEFLTKSIEIQYDNQYGFFHFDATFGSDFPNKTLVLKPDTSILFEYNTNSPMENNFDTCANESILFLVYRLDEKMDQLAEDSGFVNLTQCAKWPMGNLVFRLCPQVWMANSGESIQQKNNSVTNSNNKATTTFTSPNSKISTAQDNSMGETTNTSTKITIQDGMTRATKLMINFSQKRINTSLKSPTKNSDSFTTKITEDSTTSRDKSATTTFKDTSHTKKFTELALNRTKTISKTSETSTSTISSTLQSEGIQTSGFSSTTTNNKLFDIEKQPDDTRAQTTPDIKTIEFSTLDPTTKTHGTKSSPKKIQETSMKIVRNIDDEPMESMTTNVEISTEKIDSTISGRTNSNNLTMSTHTTTDIAEQTNLSSESAQLSSSLKPTHEKTISSITTENLSSQEQTFFNTESITSTTYQIVPEAPTTNFRETVSSNKPIKTNTLPSSTSSVTNSELPKSSRSRSTQFQNLITISNSGDALTLTEETELYASSINTMNTQTSTEQQDSTVPSYTSTISKIERTRRSTNDNNQPTFSASDLIQPMPTVTPRIIDADEENYQFNVNHFFHFQNFIIFSINFYVDVVPTDSIVECWTEKTNGSEKIPLHIDSIASTNLNVSLQTDELDDADEFDILCTMGNIESRSKNSVSVIKFANYVERKNPNSYTFAANQLDKTTAIIFVHPLPSQIENTPYCVLDEDEENPLDAESQMDTVLKCQLKSDIPIGTHQLLAIRSPILRNATFHEQTPLTVIILPISTTTTDITTSITPIAETEAPTVYTTSTTLTTEVPSEAATEDTISTTSTTEAPTVYTTLTTSTTEAPTEATTEDTISMTLTTTTTTTASTSTTTTSTSATTTTTTEMLNSAMFADNLTSILVNINSNSNSEPLTVPCNTLFVVTDKFGSEPNCSIRENLLVVSLDTDAKILPNDSIFIRSTVFNSELPTATNQENTKINFRTQSEYLTVQPPANPIEPQFFITMNQLLACQTSALLNVVNVSGDGNRELTYRWNLINGTATLTSVIEPIHGPILGFNIDMLNNLPAVITATGCNFVGKCSTSNEIPLETPTTNAIYRVQILGVPDNPLPSLRIGMIAQSSVDQCNSTQDDLTLANISHSWSVNGTVVSTNSIYDIPPKTYLPFTKLVIGLTAEYVDPNTRLKYSAQDEAIINFGAEPIVTVVDGTDKSIAADETLSIDASQSYDPNVDGGQNLQHFWTCRNVTGNLTTDTSQNMSGLPCEMFDQQWASVQWNQSILIIPADLLVEKSKHVFVDQIISPVDQLMTFISVNVAVLPPKIPAIQLVPLSGAQQKVNDYLRIQAYVISKTGGLSVKWLLFEDDDNNNIVPIELYPTFPMSQTNFSAYSKINSDKIALSFTIPPNGTQKFPQWMGLAPGHTYLLRLNATNTFGQSYVDHKFSVNSPPAPPIITISPQENIYALVTKVRFNTSSNLTSENKNFRLKFGVRTLIKGNKTIDYFFTKPSSINFHETVLPAAGPNVACGERSGYQALLHICDSTDACSLSIGPVFHVQQSYNSSAAETSLIELSEVDLASGNPKQAVEKLEIVGLQRCNMSFNSSLADQIISKLVDASQNMSDKQELKQNIDDCLRLLPSASANITPKLTILFNKMNEVFGLRIANSRRKKRDTTNTTMDKADASALVKNYEIMLLSPVPVTNSNTGEVDLYFSLIAGVLDSFCTQVDPMMDSLETNGASYTFIQVQSISTLDTNISQNAYPLANSPEKVISFGTDFQNYFTSWTCLSNGTLCNDVCLGTAAISADFINLVPNLNTHFFGYTQGTIDYAKLVSDVYDIYFGNPQTGDSLMLQNGIGFTIRIQLKSYLPSNYYKCYIFTSDSWSNSNCQSEDYATNYNGIYELQCNCSHTGYVAYIAVFSVSAPTPIPYPLYNEIELNFELSADILCTSFINDFRASLSTNTQIPSGRFVNASCSIPGTIGLILRPPFLATDISNSYAMQAISRVINMDGGFMATANVIVVKLNDTIIYRELHDNYARKIPLTIDKIFKDFVGNDSTTLAQTWANLLAANMHISSYRFKNPTLNSSIVSIGSTVTSNIKFTFTITVPFDGETPIDSLRGTALSAEEIAAMIMEMTLYGEIYFQGAGNAGNQSADILQRSQIIKLQVDPNSNTLMLVLAITVAVSCILSTLCIGGLVFMKLRTDKLIANHNANMRTINAQTVPIAVLPYEPPHVGRPPIEDEDLHNAADTVMLERPPRVVQSYAATARIC